MFNERKVTDMAIYLLRKSNGQQFHLMLMKLLYLAERRSYELYGTPMVGDALVSMDKGPVLSRTLDLINGSYAPESYWSKHIAALASHRVGCRDDVAVALHTLSEADIEILDWVWEQFGSIDRWALCEWTHDNCPEWQDPKGSSCAIEQEQLLKVLGYSDADIQLIQQEQQADALVQKAMVQS